MAMGMITTVSEACAEALDKDDNDNKENNGW